ncbi:MAG: hypothetical protein AB1744_01440, partial [Candidatus Zixiibacteriota bacterium]
MDKSQLSIVEMLRRALGAQVELGMGEIIVNRHGQDTEKSQFERSLQTVRKQPDSIDMFGFGKSELGRPQYDSVEAH